MNTAQRIIAKFGSQTALAEVLGRPQSTIQYWAKVGSIPAKWHQPILSAATARGITLGGSDFVSIETDRPPSNNCTRGQMARRSRLRWRRNRLLCA